MHIEQFLRSDRRDAWLRYPDMQIYVRQGNRQIGDEVRQILNIANIEVDESVRNNGLFSGWLYCAESWASTLKFDGILFESVSTDRFARFLQRRGYRQEKRPGLRSTNYYRIFA